MYDMLSGHQIIIFSCLWTSYLPIRKNFFESGDDDKDNNINNRSSSSKSFYLTELYRSVQAVVPVGGSNNYNFFSSYY